MQGCSFAAMEEFTFPSFPLEQSNTKNKKLPFPHFASPPPWFVGAVDAAGHDHRRSFSAVEQQAGTGRGCLLRHDGGGHGGSERRFAAVEENKMDMLWEDFNEELARAAQAQPCPLMRTTEAWLAGDVDVDVDGEVQRGSHAAAAASGGSVVRRRRLSMLMMLKLLRKLFLARKSSGANARKAPPI